MTWDLITLETQGTSILGLDFRYVDLITILILVVTIIAIIIIPSIDRSADRRHKKRKACHAIIREIEEYKTALTTDMYPSVKHGDNAYRNTFLSSDGYDSVVHSGEFMEFKTSVQNELSNFYITIKLRNEAMKELGLYENMFFIDDLSTERINRWNTSERTRYEGPMTEYENYIKTHLDSIRCLMKEELP